MAIFVPSNFRSTSPEPILDGTKFETLEEAKQYIPQRVGVPIFITSERKFYILPAIGENYTLLVPDNKNVLVPGEGITIDENNVISATDKTLAGKILDTEAPPGKAWVHLFDESGKLTMPPIIRQVNLVDLEE